MNTLSRRNLLRAFPIGFAAAALPAVVDTPAQADPSDVPLRAWQDAYRASVAAANAYSASLRVKPLNKAECDRAFNNYVATCESLAAARADLWRI
ncbi:hypothetical protein [Mesorhizobium sp. LjNodule214]|uniref:hypothetical protein n=1 Tax=Mesorhizobium sp. LjNodule214 TaxID=3342252 RepID=UPI003ECF36F6